MPIKFENVGIAVRDIDEAIGFFTALGLSGLGRDTVSGHTVSAVPPPDDIHRMSNTGDDVAISLHAYGADGSNGSSARRSTPTRS